MQPEAAAPAAAQPPTRHHHQDRVQACCQVLDLDARRRAQGSSQRALAQERDVRRSTWQSRARAAEKDGLPQGWQPFLESEAGMHFQTRLMMSIFVHFGVRGGCSVARISDFDRAMHMNKLVASSPSSLRRVQDVVLREIGVYGTAQRTACAKGMLNREVVFAVDENFHWDQMLLVAMDLVSGFLFCETPAERRDGETWKDTLTRSIEGLNVTPIALTCDAAKGLQGCADLRKVSVGSDILHIQHPLCQALTGPMARQVEKAQEAVIEAQAAVDAVKSARADGSEPHHDPEPPPDLDARERAARAVAKNAQTKADAVVERQTRIKEGILELSDQLHPVDPATGAPRDAVQVRAEQFKTVEKLRDQARAAGLSGHAITAVNKLFGRLDERSCIVAWWHLRVIRRVGALARSTARAAWVGTVLVPALDVRHCVRFGRDATTRAARQGIANTLWQGVVSSPFWTAWSLEERKRVRAVAQSCAECFPRSSSGVEGRNGQDSLCLHPRHQISPAFREARLVLHNDVIERADATTAAERLFGQRPADLIEYLCDRIKLPARGRPRTRKQRPSILALAG